MGKHQFIIVLFFLIYTFDAKTNVDSLEECKNADVQSSLNKIVQKIKIPKKNCSEGASGAWFYKVETSEKSNDKGIGATVTLPDFKKDENRVFKNGNNALPPHTVGPLDRASVYLGGSLGGAELDAGLTWDRVYKEDGSPTEDWAFRPFWRNTEDGPEKPTVWHNPAKKITENEQNNSCDELHHNKSCSGKNIYFRGKEKIQMQIEEVESSSDGKESIIKMTISNDANKKCFEVCFKQKKNPKNQNNTWKRVNSIDQFKLGPCFVNGYVVAKTPTGKEVKCDYSSSISPHVTLPYLCNEKITSRPNSKDKNGNTIKNKRSLQYPGEKDCRPSNENERVLATNASLINTKWEKVNILKRDGKTMPLKPNNSHIKVGSEFCEGELKRDIDQYFQDTSIDQQGGQSIDIKPRRPKSK